MNKYTLTGIVFAILSLFINSCTDEPLKVGFELIPDVDLLQAGSDTLAVECYTVKGASYFSIYAEKSKTDNCPIGQVIDPAFGATDIDLAMEISFNVEEDYYGKDSIVATDKLLSCKIYFKIDNTRTFGGTNGFEVEVYEMLKQMDYTSSTSYVMKSEHFDIEHNLATSTQHRVYIVDTQIPGIDSGNYYLVVDLDKDFASFLMDKQIISDYGIYKSAADFVSYFNGFFIRSHAINAVGGIENFYYKNSKMVLEYERTLKDNTGADSLVIRNHSYNITKYQNFYRQESNNFPLGPFGTQLGDTLNQRENFYVQSLGGTWGLIKIPGLETLKRLNASDSIGINLAELILPIEDENIDTTQFVIPYRLTVREYLENSPQEARIFDDNKMDWSYFNGYFNPITKDYRINLTEYVHQYLQGNYSTGKLFIIGAVNDKLEYSNLEYKVPGRVILNSGLGNKPAIVRIIYTQISY